MLLSPLKDLYYDHDSADADKKEDEAAKKKANRPSEYTPPLTDLITCSFLSLRQVCDIRLQESIRSFGEEGIA